MDGFVRLVRDLLLAAKVPASCIAVDRRVELPGWFRAEKKWDLVIVHDGELTLQRYRRHGGMHEVIRSSRMPRARSFRRRALV